VALAAFAGAGIARGDPLRTGVNASKLAIAAFLIPYIFVMSPALLMVDTTFAGVMMIIATSVVGMIGVASSVSGYFLVKAGFIERIMLFFGGLFMIDPNASTDFVGFILLAVGLAIQFYRLKRTKQ
jgi:TRAP-type uncharacterized transport system fused permease subunit